MEQFADGDAVVADDGLAALALAGDPAQPIDPDAVPISLATEATGGLLPEWYMPSATSTVRGPVRRGVVGGIVLALVVANGVGLCVTYGIPEIAC